MRTRCSCASGWARRIRRRIRHSVRRASAGDDHRRRGPARTGDQHCPSWIAKRRPSRAGSTVWVARSDRPNARPCSWSPQPDLGRLPTRRSRPPDARPPRMARDFEVPNAVRSVQLRIREKLGQLYALSPIEKIGRVRVSSDPVRPRKKRAVTILTFLGLVGGDRGSLRVRLPVDPPAADLPRLILRWWPRWLAAVCAPRRSALAAINQLASTRKVGLFRCSSNRNSPVRCTASRARNHCSDRAPRFRPQARCAKATIRASASGTPKNRPAWTKALCVAVSAVSSIIRRRASLCPSPSGCSTLSAKPTHVLRTRSRALAWNDAVSDQRTAPPGGPIAISAGMATAAGGR